MDAFVAVLQAEEPAPKWKLGYASYNEAVKNGTTTVVVDGEDDAPDNALPPRPRGHKSTKDDLAHKVSDLPLSETLKAMLAESEDAMAKRDEKNRWEKEATATIYINLTKEAIQVQRLDVEARRFDAAAKSRV
jgi:hypothetical protein